MKTGDSIPEDAHEPRCSQRCCLATLCVGGMAHAGGFQILEHGAVSTGMANARTALSDDVSALYFNPAAISELPGLQLQLGVTGILPSIHYQAAGNPIPARTYPSYADGSYILKEVNDGTQPTDAKLKGSSPIHLYATYTFEDWGLQPGLRPQQPLRAGDLLARRLGRALHRHRDRDPDLLQPAHRGGRHRQAGRLQGPLQAVCGRGLQLRLRHRPAVEEDRPAGRRGPLPGHHPGPGRRDAHDSARAWAMAGTPPSTPRSRTCWPSVCPCAGESGCRFRAPPDSPSMMPVSRRWISCAWSSPTRPAGS